MQFHRALSALLLLSVSCMAAGQSCQCNSPLTVATFNLLGTPWSVAKQERLEASVDYFNHTVAPFDLFCTQELWSPIDRHFFRDSLKSIYPYSLEASPRNNTCSPICNAAEFEQIVDCASTDSCDNVDTGFKVLSCIVDNCKSQFNNISETCNHCVDLGDIVFDVTGRLKKCTDLKEVNGVYSSCEFLFGGQSDPLLLSRYSFTKSSVYYFEVSPFSSLSMLYGEINHPTLGNVHAFCTHLTPNIPLISLSKTSLEEANEIIDYVRNTVVGNQTDELVLILGDFNSSPHVDDVDHTFPDTFSAIQSAGYADALLKYSHDNGEKLPCTYCPTDAHVPNTSPQELDHIWINSNAMVCLENTNVFATENLVTIDLDGKSDDIKTFPLSDHYAVRATICPSNTPLGVTNHADTLRTSVVGILFVLITVFFG